jgi:predicted DNA-binding transcriptional regulator AlpA
MTEVFPIGYVPSWRYLNVADRLGMSLSWLAKRRMRGDGPPFVRVGRSIRYLEAALAQWIRGNQRLSTSEG